jgi:hypothetical protein
MRLGGGCGGWATLLWVLLPFDAAAFQKGAAETLLAGNGHGGGHGRPIVVEQLGEVIEPRDGDVLAAADTPQTCGWNAGNFLGGMFCGVLLTVVGLGFLLRRSGGYLTMEFAKPAAPTQEQASRPGTPACEEQASRPGSSKEHDKRRPSMCESTESMHLFWPRCNCLVFMLLVQSVSSIVLSGFKDLIQKHVSLVYFMTMLVGLGGNAGGQSVVLAVRRLALGQPVSMMEQLSIGALLSLVIVPLAMARAWISHVSLPIILAIGLSAGVIILIACVAGTAIPVLLWSVQVDPAHSASFIQVAMDISGIIVVCSLGALMVDIVGTS